MNIRLKNPETRDTSSFGYFFSTDVLLLQFIGASSIVDIFKDSPRQERWWEVIAFIFGITIPSFVLFCEFVSVYLAAQKDLNYMVEALTATFSGLLSIMKGIRLWTHRVEIYNLLHDLSKLWESARQNDLVTLDMIKTAERTKLIRFYYCCVVIILALSYCLRPYILLISHCLRNTNETYDFSISIYPATYPFFYGEYTRYLICLGYEVIVMICVISYWITCDGLFAQITMHLSLQFEILAEELARIGRIETSQVKDDDDARRLAALAERHSDMFSHCFVAEEFFNPIIFLTVLINGAHCCFCVYSLEKEISNGNLNEIMKNLFHTMALSGQTVVYCGYADRLTYQSAKISDAIYNSHWMDKSKKFKLTLLTMLMRAQKEYVYTSYGLITLNLQRVTTIANAAMRYFTLLRSMP
ncbi:odorant receptor 82a-like [Fopius arisanus]|uniref:Odorant receptor n=1 Tax=Fopius arisanus TaxID=64838 RepID=A0A9R1TAH1_9HYME|nr:PREDICTED: odorant receptor 82a-like [Fopius arisanus]